MGMTPANRPSAQEEYITLINDVKVVKSDYFNHNSFLIYDGKCIFLLKEETGYDRNKIVIINSEKYIVISSANLISYYGCGINGGYRKKELIFLGDCPDFEFLRPAEKSSTEKWDEEEQRNKTLAGLEKK